MKGGRRGLSRAKLRFCLDENMDPEIARQLRRRGIGALAARDVDMLNVSDGAQLRFAATYGRALCSKDSDFTYPGNWEIERFGIAYFPDANLSIGYAVKALEALHRSETAESMKNSLRYL